MSERNDETFILTRHFKSPPVKLHSSVASIEGRRQDMYQEGLSLPALSSAIESSIAIGQIPDVALTSGDTRTTKYICKDGHKQKPKKKRPEVTCSVKISNPDIHGDSDLKSPGLSYIALISMAIQSASSKKMLLSEIYNWIAENFPYYQMKDKSWRNSIRHNLSLNECFVKNGRSENGKGNYWSIHPANIDDFSKGDYRRRRARRQVRKCDEDLKRLCSSSPEVIKAPTPTSSENGSHDGYVPMASTLVPSDFLSALGVERTRSSHQYLYSNLYTHPEECREMKNSYMEYKYMPKADMPYFGCDVAHNERCCGLDSCSVTSFPAESTVNVSVNVNLRGSTDTSRAECYPYAERLCTSVQPQYYGHCWSENLDQSHLNC